MEFRHRMLRASASMVIDKAIQDIPKDPRRSLRALVDFGGCLAGTEEQKQFFARARHMLSSASCPYYTQLPALVGQTDPRSLKALALNLGCSCAAWGVPALREQERRLGRHIPWLLAFREAEAAASRLLDEAGGLGVYAAVLAGVPPAQAARLARRHPECAFLDAVAPQAVNAKAAGALQTAPNLAISVLLSKGCSRAFALLRQARRLYGFHLDCAADGLPQKEDWLDKAVRDGCQFGILNVRGASPETSKAASALVKSSRSPHGKPILLIDDGPDLETANRIISPGTRPLAVPAGYDGTLRELIAREMPKGPVR